MKRKCDFQEKQIDIQAKQLEEQNNLIIGLQFALKELLAETQKGNGGGPPPQAAVSEQVNERVNERVSE